MQLAAQSRQRIMADVRRRTKAGETVADPDFTRHHNYDNMTHAELGDLAHEKGVTDAKNTLVMSFGRPSGVTMQNTELTRPSPSRTPRNTQPSGLKT